VYASRRLCVCVSEAMCMRLGGYVYASRRLCVCVSEYRKQPLTNTQTATAEANINELRAYRSVLAV
jgi:hypothetical protein